MQPRHFRATAFLCLAILAADAVVAQLPHWHSHDASGECTSSSCSHQHGPLATGHTHAKKCSPSSHSCSHHHGCSHAAPVEQPTAPSDSQPCEDCTLCRHQGQAALPVVVVPVSLVCVACEHLPDQRDAQITSVTPRVYRGRGPPAVL